MFTSSPGYSKELPASTAIGAPPHPNADLARFNSPAADETPARQLAGITTLDDRNKA